MKKIIIILSTGLLIIMGLLLLTASKLSDQPKEEKATCENIPLSEVSSQRALGLLISNRQLLTIKLGDEKNFSPPGGHISGNESPENALKRELQEEVGLTVSIEDLSKYKVNCVLSEQQSVRTYYYLIDAPEEQTASIANVDDSLKWVNYTFVDDKKADQELKQALFFLKSDGLID